jgi:hypothetical protein
VRVSTKAESGDVGVMHVRIQEAGVKIRKIRKRDLVQTIKTVDPTGHNSISLSNTVLPNTLHNLQI